MFGLEGSYRIFTIRGIPIRIHVSFLLILPLLALLFGRAFGIAAEAADVPPERLVGAPWLWGLGLAVALFSARFLLPGGFMTEGMAFHLEARPAVFLVHVAGGATALALGAFQLVTWRGPRRRWHRWAGRVYVAACLAGAVAGLLADPAARKACGVAGRRRVLSRYGWARVAAATEAAYCEVLDAEPAATGTG